MKLLAIVDTNADFSYNRFLEQFMAKRYQDQAEIEVCEIASLPRFRKETQSNSRVEEFKNRIREIDDVTFATPEYDRGTPSSLKSTTEWIGSHAQGNTDVMRMKPAMVLGASYDIQGASRAQEEMRGILLSPNQGANVLPEDEILVSHAADKFDKNTGGLLDQETIRAIDLTFSSFVKFVERAKR